VATVTGAATLLGGVVLCGGASRRMGRDKARLDLGGRTLLERAVALLAARAPRVALACGPVARYGELGLPLLLDRPPAGALGAAERGERPERIGPLAGLEAALAGSLALHPQGGAVLAVACDLPALVPADLDPLLERALEGSYDAVLYETARGPEPLCAVWHTDLLPAVRAALDAGERKATAPLARALPGGRLPRVARLAGAPRALERNLNTPADVASLEERP
jgi:molybdopterin-guanine dinucleotide biosynthesis protein A